MKRQSLALTGLAMVVAGCVWAAVAQASTDVTFFGIKGSDTVTFPDDFPTKDVSDTYKIGDDFRKIEGYSLTKVLAEIGVGPDGWTRVFFDNGQYTVRNGEQYAGDKDPVFFLSEDKEDVIFLIPKKSDTPARKVRKGLDFTYRAAIDIEPDEIDPPAQGDSQTFEATIVGVGAQNDYKFEWVASTGETGTGRTFEVTFTTSGRVEIGVTAKRNGNLLAEQAIATPVKKAPTENDSGTGGSGYGGGGTSYGSGYGGYTPPADSYDPNFPNIDSSTPTPNFPDSPDTPKDTTVPEEETGTSVAGELLSAIAPLEPASGKESPASEDKPTPDTAVSEPENEEVSAPGALIATGVIVGLMGLGAGRELENVRPRRFLRRPDLSALRRLTPPWK